MKRTFFLLAIIIIVMLFNCKKEESNASYFNHTNHQISLLGDSMRLVIQLPNYAAFYNFSADSNQLNGTGDSFYYIFVESHEMIMLAENLSDTLIFNWEDMTSQSPYPLNECVLLIYGGLSNEPYIDYMCSIGSNESAAKIIEELGKSLTGIPNKVFSDINKLLLASE